jgi:thiol:disulfide interchange protein DsbD
LLLLTLFAVGPVANGQGVDAYVRWSAAAVETAAEPGINLQLALKADITEGWKMYAMDSPRPSRGVDITVTGTPADVKVVGSVRQEDPRHAFDPNFQIDVTYFVGTADFVFDLDVAREVDRSQAILGVDVLFQICNDALGICLPPTTRPLSIRLDGSLLPAEDCLAENGEATATEECEVGDLSLGFASGVDESKLPRIGESGTPPPAYSDSLLESRSGGFFAFLLLAIGAGLAALLTPCVFPMIPLTISYFTRHSKRRSEAVRMATTYGVAIIATFTGLGVLMSLLVGAAGAQSIAASPWVNLFIATVLVLFALSLLGLFELRLPTGVVNFFNRQGTSRSGYLGVLFMGFTLTLVSFSCTAPFVGGLLAATVGGEWFYPIVGMLAFSAAFALPFVFLALFPKALDALPRSGSWMNVFKVTLGFIELAAAIKFLSNVDLVWGWDIISRPLAIAATIVIFGVAGLYLLGKLSLGHEERPASIGVGRLVSAVVFMALALYMLPGLFGAPLNAIDAFLPPRQVTDVSLYSAFPESMAREDDLWITDDIDGAMDAAASAGKPLLIDFTGYTCTNCRQMEASVFTRAEVIERFERDYVLSRLYTDGLDHGERFQRYQLGLTGTVALPTYAVVNPVGRLLVAKASGVMSLDDFVAFLDRGARDYAESHLATK